MYCARCGVKLADTEKQCPLCGTVAFHPDITREAASPLYPPQKVPAQKVSKQGALIILTTAFLLPMLITLLVDLRVYQTVTWSGFVIGALAVGYEVLVLPIWFRKPNPVIFVPCGFAAAGVYLLYISLATGGKWFLSFAFPMTGGVALIVTTLVVLLRYVRRGKLYMFGGAFLAFGGLMLLAEFLMDLTFGLVYAGWSIYPLAGFGLVGVMLLFLAINPRARENMERKMFI